MIKFKFLMQMPTARYYSFNKPQDLADFRKCLWVYVEMYKLYVTTAPGQLYDDEDQPKGTVYMTQPELESHIADAIHSKEHQCQHQYMIAAKTFAKKQRYIDEIN